LKVTEDIEKLKRVDAKIKSAKENFHATSMSLNDFVFVKPPVSVPIVLQSTVITLSFLLFEISEVTMAAMRKNHTGQRQRSNDSFTPPTPGSAVRQVA
jgi:hypothetical protein